VSGSGTLNVEHCVWTLNNTSYGYSAAYTHINITGRFSCDNLSISSFNISMLNFFVCTNGGVLSNCKFLQSSGALTTNYPIITLSTGTSVFTDCV
jgi:hypothetical protein